MRRLVVAAAAGLVLSLGVVAGLAVAHPESLPAALVVTSTVSPSGAVAPALVDVTPTSAMDGGVDPIAETVTTDRALNLRSLPAGGYEVRVTSATADSDVVGLMCSPADAVVRVDGSEATLTLLPGREVICEASLAERGRIVLTHRSRPASDRAFDYKTPWGDLRLGHDATERSPLLPAGTHAVKPDLPGGWDVARSVCSDGSEPSAVELAPGETVRCTVVTARRGRIVVAAQADPGQTERLFRFRPSWGPVMAVGSDDRQPSRLLPPGSYDVRARTPQGWDQTGQCSDGSQPSDIDLNPGERVTCTFTATKRGRVVVVNEPDVETTDETQIEPSWGESFTLAGPDSQRSRLLPPGRYSVTADPSSGWALTTSTCDDGSTLDSIDLAAGETVTCTVRSTQPRFTVATFNVLGHSHTQPGGRVPAYASGPQRMSGTLQQLRAYGVDIVGFQELQNPQLDAFVRLGGSDYDIYPSPGIDQRNKQNAIAWRSSEFTLVQGRPIMTPYFKGNRVPMPLVRLRHNETGLEVYVMTVHNPASVARVGDQSRWRQAATAQQIALTNQLLAEGVPVLMTGDMNERERYFCAYTGATAMRAAAGGSNDAGCRPPPASIARIDWIFGSPDVAFSDYRFIRNSQITRISDHPLIVAEAALQ